MKKIAAFLLLTAFSAAGLFGSAVYAANEAVEVTADKTQAAVGDTVTVSIDFTGDDSAAVFMGNISWDDTVLSAVSAGSDINLENSTVVFGSPSETSITFQVIGDGCSVVSVSGTAALDGSAAELFAASAEIGNAAAMSGEETEDPLADIVPASDGLRQAAPDENQSSSDELSTIPEISDAEETQSSLNVIMSSASLPEGVVLPDKAEQVTINYKGTAIQGAKTAGGLYLVPVSEEDGSIVWYIYDEEADNAIPYERFVNLSGEFVILPAPASLEVPEEFQACKISVDGTTLPAWRNPLVSDSDMFFVYAQVTHTDGEIENGIYRFDGKYGYLVRYVEDVTIVETTETEPPTDDPVLVARVSRAEYEESSVQSMYDELSDQREKDILYRSLIIIAMAAALLILFLIIIVLAVKLSHRKNDEDEEEEDEDDEEFEEEIPVRKHKSREEERPVRRQRREADEEEELPRRRKSNPVESTSQVRQVKRSRTEAAEEGPERKASRASEESPRNSERRRTRRTDRAFEEEAALKKGKEASPERRNSEENEETSSERVSLRKKKEASFRRADASENRETPTRRRVARPIETISRDTEDKQSETAGDEAEFSRDAALKNDNMTESVRVATRRAAEIPSEERKTENSEETDFKEV